MGESKSSQKFGVVPSTYHRSVHMAVLKPHAIIDLTVVSTSKSTIAQSLQGFLPRQLYMLASTANLEVGFYVWMSRSEFEHMKAPNNLKELQVWLSSFPVPCISDRATSFAYSV